MVVNADVADAPPVRPALGSRLPLWQQLLSVRGPETGGPVENLAAHFGPELHVAGAEAVSNIVPLEEAPHDLDRDRVPTEFLGAPKELPLGLGEYGGQFPDMLQEPGQGVIDRGGLSRPPRPEHGKDRVLPAAPRRDPETTQPRRLAPLLLQCVGHRAGVAEAGHAHVVVVFAFSVRAQDRGHDLEHLLGAVVVDEADGLEPGAALRFALAAFAGPGDVLVDEVQPVRQPGGQGGKGGAPWGLPVEEDAFRGGGCQRRPDGEDDSLAGDVRAVRELL